MENQYCIRFEDDLELVADLEESINEMLLSLTNAFQKFQLRINSNKTK